MTPETRKTLQRASTILDDLEARMAPALKVLESVHSKEPLSGPFDEIRARRWLHTAVQFYFIREVDLSVPPMSAAKRAKRYRDLHNSLKVALRKLEDVIEDPELSNEFLGAWWSQVKGDGQQFFHIESEARGLLDSLGELASGAHVAATQVQKKPGAPKNSTIPKSLILELADCYREATGIDPTSSSTGKFAQFVREFMSALGKLRYENTTDARRNPVIGYVAEDTIHDAVKGALKCKD